jgi:hypothetical protein
MQVVTEEVKLRGTARLDRLRGDVVVHHRSQLLPHPNSI